MKILIALACSILLSAGLQAATRTDTLHVSGNCGSCKKKIESPFKDMKGVESAKWDKHTKLFVVNYDPEVVSIAKIKETIVAQGYDTEGLVASEAVYNKLPKCCQYRSGSHEE